MKYFIEHCDYFCLEDFTLLSIIHGLYTGRDAFHNIIGFIRSDSCLPKIIFH